MHDIKLSARDRKRLIELLAVLFPDNTRADPLLDLVHYPLGKRSQFNGRPKEAWRDTFADFDRAGPGDIPYTELLVRISRIRKDLDELVELTATYRAEDRTPTKPPRRVLVLGTDDSTSASSCGGQELRWIRQAEGDGYVMVDVCPVADLGPDRLRAFNPEILHLSGRYDGDVIRLPTGTIKAGDLLNRIDRHITDHRAKIDLIVFGGGAGWHLRDLFASAAHHIVTHDEHVRDDLSIRFTRRLYELVPIAPSIHSAVRAAHTFALEESHMRMADSTMHLSWTRLQTEGRPGADRRTRPSVFAARRPRDDITLDEEALVTFEKAVAHGFRRAQDARHLMLQCGFPTRLANSFSEDGDRCWNRAFIEISEGTVNGTPYRTMLERAFDRYPGDPQLARLAQTYLDVGDARSPDGEPGRDPYERSSE